MRLNKKTVKKQMYEKIYEKEFLKNGAKMKKAKIDMKVHPSW